MGSISSNDALKKAKELDREYRVILDERASNRDLLRLLDANGGLNEKEKAELLELYPPRKKGEGGAEGGAEPAGEE